MTDDVEVAEDIAGAVKELGLRKYLWLYFFIVPLAAATASCVAIAIAALQGLADHPLAMQIYAAIVLASAKTVFVFGCSYGLGVVLAMLTSSLRLLRQSRSEIERLGRIAKLPDGLTKAVLNSTFSPWRRREGLMLQMSVAYAAVACIGGLILFVRHEIVSVYQLLEQIAALPPAPAV